MADLHAVAEALSACCTDDEIFVACEALVLHQERARREQRKLARRLGLYVCTALMWVVLLGLAVYALAAPIAGLCGAFSGGSHVSPYGALEVQPWTR